MRDDLTFLHGNHTPRCIATVDKRFDYHTLQFMVRGGIELFYDDARHELRGAWLWPCHPGPWIRFHEWPRGRAWEHRYLAFTGPRVAEWEATGLWLRRPESVAAVDLTDLRDSFDRMIGLALRPGRWSRLRAINLLERILLERAEKRRAAAPDRPAWLDAVMSALADLSREPDYTELASSLGMALTTLRRRFRAATGHAMHAYRLECRIAEARRQVGETDAPIKQIADRLGYQDVFYFTRQFKQISGVSPAAYRRSRQT